MNNLKIKKTKKKNEQVVSSLRPPPFEENLIDYFHSSYTYVVERFTLNREEVDEKYGILCVFEFPCSHTLGGVYTAALLLPKA